jgi:hypothetical protein
MPRSQVPLRPLTLDKHRMTSSPNPFVRKTRGLPRRDYNALNNGTSSLLPEPGEGNILEMESPCSPAPSESTGAEGTSPSVRSSHIPSSSPAPLDPELSGLASNQSSPPPCKRRKVKSYSSWTLEHFWITELDNTWRRRADQPIEPPTGMFHNGDDCSYVQWHKN